MSLKALILCVIVIIGFIAPFSGSFTVFQFFFLLIPYTIYFLFTLVILLVSYLIKSENRDYLQLVFLVLPVFILAQIVSTILVDYIQKARAEYIIVKIEESRTEYGRYPEKHEPALGIKYSVLKNGEHFKLTYNIGFLMSEVYYSESDKWIKRGWGD